MTKMFSTAVLRRFAAIAIILATAHSALAQRQMERLGRGTIVLHSATSQAYISWRLLVTDPSDVGFNLYRSANGAAWVKLNTLPLTNTTDYVDALANLTISNAWYVVPVTNGIEGTPGAPRGLVANAPVRQYISWPLQPVAGGAFPPYDVKFCWVGDLDGDGEYDYVVDRQSTTANVNQYLQAYKSDGTFLWQMDMGYNSTNQYNIEPGASAISVGDKDNVTVYDLDGDGKAEVCVRIARGVVLPNGTTVTAPDDTVQYLSILNGMTGQEMARTTITNLWPADGPLNSHFGVMYSDGIRPTLVIEGENRNASSVFQRETMAYDYRNGQLSRRWFYTPPNGSNLAWGHQIRIMDVNHDGIDDLIEVGSAKNGATGLPLYDTELVHGDRFHVTDIDPDRPGLEMFSIQQLNPTLLATALIDMSTGSLIKKWYSGTITDVGRGIAVDIDPNHRGLEFYSTQPGIFDCKGNQIQANSVWPPEALWWDADLGREFIDGPGAGATSPVVNKYDPVSNSSGRLYSIYKEGVHQNYGGRPTYWGDIMGDWREEVVLMANDYSELRVYCTQTPATNRIYCLMQDPAYRCQCTCKGYYQASYVDYFLGNEMPQPPVPPVSNAKLVWHGDGTNVWDAASTSNWYTNWFYVGNANTNRAPFTPGDTVLFDMTSSNNPAINLTGSLTPGDVRVHSPYSFTFNSTNGSLDGVTKLTKGGAGRLTLNGTNNFSGATLVSEGLLVVNGSLPNSKVTVRGGVWLDGRLGGNGIIGSPVTFNEGAGVSPGQGTNSPGTLTIANNVIMAGRTLSDFDLSDDPSGAIKTNDMLQINGNLTLQGTNTLRVRQLNGTLPPGSIYPLINYSGSLTGSLNNLIVSGLTGIPFGLTNPPGQIALVVKSYRAPGTVTWTGGSGGNNWDLLTTPNWLNGATKDLFAPNDTVRFDNTGATNLTVNLAGDLNAANVVVDSTANYTFNGSGALFGSSSLTKTNSGTLTINALNNTYTGKTIVAGGTLVVAELDAMGFPSPLGNPPGGSTNLILSGNATLRVTSESYTDRGMTINAGTNTLDVQNAADQLTIANTIIGTGALQKMGAGALALTVSNGYTGGTFLFGGSVSLGSVAGNQYGFGSGLVTMSNVTVSLIDIEASENCAWNMRTITNTVNYLNCDGRSTMSGSLTGAGTINVFSPYVRTDLAGNWSAFQGTVNATGGNYRMNNANGYPLARVHVGAASFQNRVGGTPTISLGELSGDQGGNCSGGTGSDGVAVNWSVGGLNTSATFASDTYNNIGFIKVGTGTWTWTGTNITHTGQNTVNGGTWQVGNGGINGSLGTGSITVGAAGTLAFNRSDAITDAAFSAITGAGNVAKRGAGSLTLSKAHTFGGAMTIEAGTLALSGAGSIANSSNINVLANALLDVSATTSGAMTLASGKMISGYGAVKGNFIVASGARLAPGGSIGTLTFSNALTLNAGSTSLFEISKLPLTNDVAKVLGTFTSGGTLIVTNIGAVPPAAGDTYRLFNAASYSGAFNSLVLPALPAGLGWNTNGINTSGILAVVVTAKPLIGAVNAVLGGGLQFAGGGGVANANYYLLGASNLSTPPLGWLRLLTNQFDNSGNFNFTFTNAPNTNWPQGFYQLQVP